MSDVAGYSYDEVPYLSSSHSGTHPDTIATIATLLGMKPAPPERARVLELGSGTGGNLIPMAESLPGSRFLGIDLSARQVAVADEMVRDLGLKNIEFRAQSILDLPDDLGTFDYILCHGVYSWVPPAVQEKILSVSKRHLPPQGLAYISYNTYPGWHQRGMIRELLGFHVKQFPTPEERVRQARAFLSFLSESAVAPDEPYARIFRQEAELLAKEPDYYLFHEHLEDANQPLYFHQFMARAAAVGLQYVGEALRNSTLMRLSAQAKESLAQVATDLVSLEQYADFLCNRTFRRTLLCHASVTLNRAPAEDVLAGFRLGALARPESDHPDITSPAREEFRAQDGTLVATNLPVVKALLCCLFRSWPGTVTLDELQRQVRDCLGTDNLSEDWQQTMSRSLLDFYLSNVVALHVHVPPIALEAGERPRARDLARYQATKGMAITNLRHRVVTVNDLDRIWLPLLDGTRTRSELIDAALQIFANGQMTVHHEGQEVADAATIRSFLAESLEPSLYRLARSSLLLG